MNEKTLAEFRKNKDEHWKEDEQSPLTEKQKRTFQGLKYFAPNGDLSFEVSEK